MKRTIIVLSLICLTISLHAQLLWKVTRSDINGASYIFGTHHVAPISICDSIKGFQEAFDQCEQLYGEIRLEDATPDEIQQRIGKIMTLPGDSTLDQLLSSSQYTELNEALMKYIGLNIDYVAKLKPAALSTQFSMAFSLRAFENYDPTQQLDLVLQRKAREAGKHIDGFESIDFQANLLFNAPIKEQIDELMSVVRTPDPIGFNIRLARVYMQQNIDSLYTLMLESGMNSNDAYAQKMIYDRNSKWMREINVIFPEKPTFVVVGAGHLAGDKGLLALLRQIGYTVEPVY